MDDISEKNTIKVIATYKELDYKGNVKTTVLTKDIPWSVNPEDILKYTIKHGTMKGFAKPFEGRYYNDLMSQYFGIKEHDKVWRPVQVETETLSCGAKFVFQRHGEGCQVMEWEDVK